MASATPRIGFIGCGMMGQALLHGMLNAGVISPGNAWAADPYTKFENLEWIAKYRVGTSSDNCELVQKCDVIFLAVKPFLVETMTKELRKSAGADAFKGKLIVSMVSGWSLKRLAGLHMGTDRFVRIMPNIPALVGAACTAICPASACSKEDTDLVRSLMNGVGKCWVLPENRMNMWTATAGAGPAYVFLFIEAIADAGVAGGLPRDVANEMAIQMVLGASKMAQESNNVHLAQLRDNVCSPGGVTIAGVQELHEQSFPGSVMAAITTARERYDEIENDPNQ